MRHPSQADGFCLFHFMFFVFIETFLFYSPDWP